MDNLAEPIVMDKETFYNHLLKKETDIKFLFENYEGEDFLGLLRYVKKRVNEEFAFPNDNPLTQRGKPFISEIQRYRFGIFGLTLDTATTYNEADYFEAINFLDLKNN